MTLMEAVHHLQAVFNDLRETVIRRELGVMKAVEILENFQCLILISTMS